MLSADAAALPRSAPVRPAAATSAASPPVPAAALDLVKRHIATLDAARHELALVYAVCEGGTVAEQEIGEALTVIRKALVRLRKARGELAEYTQQELPLDE